MRGNSTASETAAKRRILLIDDHPLVRRGLTALIDNESDLIVCAEATGYRTGLEAIAAFRPDLVITDLSLGDGDGFDLIQEIRSDHGDLPLLVLSMHEAPIYAIRAFHAGASGYASKGEIDETLLTAIRQVLGGERYVSPKMRAGVDQA